MNRLRNRLITVFLLATLLPLGLTLWTTLALLEHSLNLRPLDELDAVSKSLEKTGQKLYQQTRESLRRDAAEKRIPGPRRVDLSCRTHQPPCAGTHSGAKPGGLWRSIHARSRPRIGGRNRRGLGSLQPHGGSLGASARAAGARHASRKLAGAGSQDGA